MRRKLTLEDFELLRDMQDSPETRIEKITLRCGCYFDQCQGWVAEYVEEPTRPWQALPDFIGPLQEGDPNDLDI
jgi:hypothetical protein